MEADKLRGALAKLENAMSDGNGCKCGAYWRGECSCDVDWTPKEIYDLRAERDELKRKVENLEKCRIDQRRIEHLKYLRAQLELVGWWQEAWNLGDVIAALEGRG